MKKNFEISSKKVAEKFGKSHRNVILCIERLIKEIGKDQEYFKLSKYKSKQNKIISCYCMNLDGYRILGMSMGGNMSHEFKIGLISEFNRMEKSLYSYLDDDL